MGALPLRMIVEVHAVTTPTDPIEDLQARVAFLEETIYTLAAMLTGRVAREDFPTTGRIPLSGHEQGQALTVFADSINLTTENPRPAFSNVEATSYIASLSEQGAYQVFNP